MKLFNLIGVGLGGFVGAILRYLISGWVQRFSNSILFPYGTLTVNLIGCFLIGLLGGWVESKQVFSPEIRMFLFIGLLGGFTTFSTFGYESFQMLRDGQILATISNIFLQVVGGLIFVVLGFILSRII